MRTHIRPALSAAIVVVALAGCSQATEPPPVSAPETSSPSATPTPSPTVEEVPTEITPEAAWELCLETVTSMNLQEDPDGADTYDYKPYTAANVKDLGDGVLRASIVVTTPDNETGSLSFCEVSGDPASPDVEYTGTVDGS